MVTVKVFSDSRVVSGDKEAERFVRNLLRKGLDIVEVSKAASERGIRVVYAGFWKELFYVPIKR